MENSQMFFILNIAIKKFLDFRVEGCQSFFFLNIREVEVHIRSRRHDVEFGVEHINPMDDSVQSRHSEGHMALILSHCVLAENTKLRKNLG